MTAKKMSLSNMSSGKGFFSKKAYIFLRIKRNRLILNMSVLSIAAIIGSSPYYLFITGLNDRYGLTAPILGFIGPTLFFGLYTLLFHKYTKPFYVNG